MQNLIINEGFYWENFSSDIKSIIKACPICTSNIHNKIKMPIKLIEDFGPHYRYICDIWYLDEDLKKNNDFKYCLDVIDHFSKFLYSYLLKDKSMESVLSKIKIHFFNHGKCKFFQTDNGSEFKNRELKIYLENENICQIFSSIRHPQTNGCVEATHKTVRSNLLKKLKVQKNNFDIEIALTDFLIMYNNSVHSSTKKNHQK